MPKPSPAALGFLILLVICAVLSLYRLGEPAFWDDEAATCTFARNLVDGRGLSGWDGRNLYGYHDGAALDENFRFRDPPLGTALVAASFELLGVSDWAGRLPFALCGLLSLIALWKLLRIEFPNLPLLALYGTAALGLSVSFLLCIRTARYYALSILFSILIVFFYRRFLFSRRYGDALWLAVAAAGAFFSNYVVCGAFLGALLICHLAFHRKELEKRDWKPLVAAALLFVLATLPYSLYYRVWVRADFADPTPWGLKHARLIWWNLRDVNLFAVLPWPAALVLALLLFTKCRKWLSDEVEQGTKEWTLLAGSFIFLLALLSPQKWQLTGIAELRYIYPVLPLLAGLLGVLAWTVHQYSKPAAIALLAVVVSTNVLTLTPLPPSIMPHTGTFRLLLPMFIQEITNPFPTANGEASRFLEENASQDDLVCAMPEYMNYPIFWYVGDKVKICCQLDNDSSLPESKVRRLNTPAYSAENFPDWFFVFGASPEAYQKFQYFSRAYPVNGVMGSRHYSYVATLPTYWSEDQRPELPWHAFGPRRYIDPSLGDRPYVHVFHADPWQPAAK